MDRNRHRQASKFFSQAVLAMAIAGASVVLAEPSANPTSGVATTAPATTNPAKKELPDLAPIEKQVSEIRGLTFKVDVPAEEQSLADFEKFVSKELDEEFPENRRDDMMAALVRLGLLLKPIDLQKEFKDALLSQAGAYYEPQSKKFYYLMSGLPKMFMDVIASHELVHALQDQ